MYAIRSYYGIDLVARAKQDRVGTRIAESRSDGDLVVWQRPNKPPRMTREEYRNYPKHLVMREVPVDARDNRITSYNVCYTKLLRFPGSQHLIYSDRSEEYGSIPGL